MLPRVVIVGIDWTTVEAELEISSISSIFIGWGGGKEILGFISFDDGISSIK